VDKELIKKIISEEIPDANCFFEGDSCNFKLTVSSTIFRDMNLIDQHRKVLRSLKDKFESGDLHALSLETIAI
jgi:acid stress-induced BolA-like protein IbaG/YrbA|tara:strand:- start:1203 stop:1421 length:219 start_codon:yes stop_codon:yes gene_type:complete